MLNFTWNVFSQTGSIDTYLLFKELEKEVIEGSEAHEDDPEGLNSPVS
ncbi:YqzL family protein [Priestia aryabhattai]|nr:YqzL family protein [Priestia aryabhattai]